MHDIRPLASLGPHEQSARELSLRLAEIDGTDGWTQERAREWWATVKAPA